MVNKYNSIQEYLDKIKEERKREKESVLSEIEYDNLEGHKTYLSRLKKRRIENRIESILNEFGSEIKRNILFSINEQNNIKNIQLKQKDDLINLINNKISYYNKETDEFNKKFEEVKNTINKLKYNKSEMTNNLLFSFKEYKEKRDKNKNNCKLISSFKIFLEGYFDKVIKLINKNITVFNNEFFIDDGNVNFLKLWFIFDNDKKFTELFLRNIQDFNKRKIEEKNNTIIRQAEELTNKNNGKDKVNSIGEFAEIEDLKWDEITFKIIHQSEKIEIKARDKTTGTVQLKKFGFMADKKVKNKVSVFWDLLRDFSVNHNRLPTSQDMVTDPTKLKDRVSRLRQHLRRLFPNIKDKYPITQYTKKEPCYKLKINLEIIWLN